MADKMTPQQRHYCMSRIRANDTRPEMIVRRYLHSRGFRFSLHRRDLPGRPDIVLRKYHTVIFVHGCFWHGHPACSSATTPKTRTEFWMEKIRRNKERDADVMARLQTMGWSTLVVWECELKARRREATPENGTTSPTLREATLSRLERELRIRLEPSAIHPIPASVRRLAETGESVQD